MSSRKRILKDSTGFNEDVNTGNLKKKKKLDSGGEIGEKALDEKNLQNSAPKVDETVNKPPMGTETSGPHRNVSLRREKCPICTDKVQAKEMKLVTLEEEKLVLAAMIPDRFASVAKPTHLTKLKYVRVCFDHLVEASTRIEKYIDDPKAVEKMLMPQIQSVNPNLSSIAAECLLTRFLRRNSKRQKRTAPYRGFQQFRCLICKKQRLPEKLNHFSSMNTKVVVVISRVLNGTFAREEAQLYITSKRDPVCRKHAKNSIKTIQSVLDIGNAQDIEECSLDLMKELMVTVNSLIPDMTTLQFKKSVKLLAKKIEPSHSQNETKIHYNLKCAVCKRLQSSNKQSQVRSKSVKTMLMIRCVLKGTHTSEEAQQFIESGKLGCICHKHFKKAIERIYKLLEIRSAQEIEDCSAELIKKLMETFNDFLPSMTIPEFKESVRDFATKIERLPKKVTELAKESELTQEQNEAYVSPENKFTCGVCELVHPKEKFISVKSAKSKMMIMIGCILRETHTMEEAEQFITSGNKEYSCRRHFRKSIKKICELLEIETSSEIFTCSIELMKKLMVKVNCLLRDITVLQFKTAVLKLREKIEVFEVQKLLQQ